VLSAPFHTCADDESALVELVERICALRTAHIRRRAAARLRRCRCDKLSAVAFAQSLQQLAERGRRERWHGFT